MGHALWQDELTGTHIDHPPGNRGQAHEAETKFFGKFPEKS